MPIVRNAEFPLDNTFNINGDGSYTVDKMLKEHTRITRYVTDLVNRDLFSPKIYSSMSVSGGVLVYNRIDGKTPGAITNLRTAKVAPGGEFPEIDQTEVSEQFTTVTKTGLKIAITDEARIRNDMRFLQMELQRVANRIVADVDADAVEAFRVVENDPASDMPKIESRGWTTVNKTKAADKVPADSIEADLEDLRLKVKEIDLGYGYSTLLMHPTDRKNLRLAVGIGNEAAFLSQWGWSIEDSNHVNPGEAYLLAPQQIGVIGVESPIQTETWREAKHQTSYSQTWTTQGHAITDPYAIIKIEGLAQ